MNSFLNRNYYEKSNRSTASSPGPLKPFPPDPIRSVNPTVSIVFFLEEVGGQNRLDDGGGAGIGMDGLVAAASWSVVRVWAEVDVDVLVPVGVGADEPRLHVQRSVRRLVHARGGVKDV